MDVKLADTEWHRITAAQMREINAKQRDNPPRHQPVNKTSTAERNRILLQGGAATGNVDDYPSVESDGEEQQHEK